MVFAMATGLACLFVVCRNHHRHWKHLHHARSSRPVGRTIFTQGQSRGDAQILTFFSE